MSPAQALDLLAVRKAAVRVRIAERRQAIAATAAPLRGPLGLVDRGLALWRRVPPEARVAAVPVGMWLARLATKRAGGPLGLLKFAPVLASLLKRRA